MTVGFPIESTLYWVPSSMISFRDFMNRIHLEEKDDISEKKLLFKKLFLLSRQEGRVRRRSKDGNSQGKV